MKTTLLIVLFVFTSLFCYSTNEELSFDGYHWTYLFAEGPMGQQKSYLSFYVEGDSIVDGIVRSKVYGVNNLGLDYPPLLIGLLHTKDKKIYFRPTDEEHSNPHGSFGFILKHHKDHLIYDFSLEKGDKLILSEGEEYEHTIYVIDTDSVELGGLERKRILFSDNKDSSSNSYWIEGIGSSEGLFYSYGIEEWPTCDCYRKFICCSKDDETLYLNPEFDNCPDFLVSSIDISEKKSFFQVVYETKNIRIELGNSINNGELFIYTVNGQVYKTINISNESTINIPTGTFPKGIYFIEIMIDNHSEVKKIMIAN